MSSVSMQAIEGYNNLVVFLSRNQGELININEKLQNVKINGETIVLNEKL